MKKMLSLAVAVMGVASTVTQLVHGTAVPTMPSPPIVPPSADGVQWFSACATGTSRSSESSSFYLPGANPNGPNAPTYPLKGYTIETGLRKDCTAYGYYIDSIAEVGWGYLHMESSQNFEQYTPQDMAYAAGYLEGYLTSEPTYLSIVNSFPELFNDHNGTCPQAVIDWIQENNEFQDKMIAANPNDPYWSMVGVQWAQVQGIYDGYQAVAPNSEPMSLESLAILNLLAEISDIETVTNATLAAQRDPLAMHNFHQVVDFLTKNSHCSAVIRLTPGNADLIPAHTTWTGFENMLRVYKYYNIANAGGVHFSSYPGTIASSDDYYTTDAGLVVIETTNSIANMSLYQYVTPQTVPCFIRTMVANALAVTGQEWTQLFAKFNSGTYSNQWMVVDFKQFTIGETPRAGTLWIAEQMPGQVVSGDVTDVLIKQGYWASYNIAYFPQVWAEMGYADLVKEYGDMGAYYYDYYGSFRQLIFARDAPTVDSIEGVQRLIRQNNWQTDPYSKNCSELAVASRQDLSVGPLSAGRSPFGSIDGKVTSASLWNPTTHYVRAQSGPTYENQAPFVWSTSGLSNDAGHLGQPDRWEFPWVEYVVQRVNPPNPVRHHAAQKAPIQPQEPIMEA